MSYFIEDNGTLLVPVIVREVELYLDSDPLYRVEVMDELLEDNGLVKTDDWCDISDDEKFLYISDFTDFDYGEIIRFRNQKEWRIDIVVEDTPDMRWYLERGDNKSKYDGLYESGEWYNCDDRATDFIFDWFLDNLGQVIWTGGSMYWETDKSSIRHKKISELGI